MSGYALALGTGLQAYGSYSSGVQKRDAYQVQAAQKRATAAEVQIGADRETKLVEQAARRTSAAQQVAFGKSGVSVGSGSPLAVLEQTASNAFDQMQSIKQAADYRKSTLITDAQQSEILGGQAYDSGVLGMFASGLSGFSKNPYLYDSPVDGGNQNGSILTNEQGDYAPSDYYGTRDYRRGGGNL